MRSRFNLFIAVLVLIGLIFLLNGLNVVNYNTQDDIDGYVRKASKKRVYVTRKRHINHAKTGVLGLYYNVTC